MGGGFVRFVFNLLIFFSLEQTCQSIFFHLNFTMVKSLMCSLPDTVIWWFHAV